MEPPGNNSSAEGQVLEGKNLGGAVRMVPSSVLPTAAEGPQQVYSPLYV